jgi:hypothetical protein
MPARRSGQRASDDTRHRDEGKSKEVAQKVARAERFGWKTDDEYVSKKKMAKDSGSASFYRDQQNSQGSRERYRRRDGDRRDDRYRPY